MFSLRHYYSAPLSLLTSRGVPDEPDSHPTSSLDSPTMISKKPPSSPLSPSSPPSLTPFDFERMTACFEHVQQLHHVDPHPLPPTSDFVLAMREVVKLFETLGTAFTFVKRDMDNKIAIIERFQAQDAHNFANLHDALLHEITTNSARIEPGDPPSLSRTLLRLMWALKFADLLLDGLKMAFDMSSSLPPTERTLKWTVARAYEAALAEHHSWTIRRAVKSACLLLPTKEAFIDRVGVKPDCRDQFLSRLAVSMSPLVKRMYAFYESNHLLDLP